MARRAGLDRAEICDVGNVAVVVHRRYDLAALRIILRMNIRHKPADSDDLARVYRYDLAQDSEMISPTITILMSPGA